MLLSIYNLCYKPYYCQKQLFFAISILISFFSSTLYPQQYHFKNYSVEDGLAFVQISNMYQDSKGYLWSGGYGGLSKFDGKEFINFSPKNGLAHHSVTSIIEDTAHRMFIGTIEGLSIITNKSIKNYYIKHGLPSEKINCLAKGQDGTIWVGTQKGLCYYTKNNEFKEVLNYHNIAITALYVDNNQNLWIGSANGLYSYSKVANKHYSNLTDSFVTCITGDPNSATIYIGTKKGVSVFDKKSINITAIPLANNDEITSLYLDSESELWIGTNQQLYKYNGKFLKSYTINNGDYNSNHIRCIIRDAEYNLWIGTHNGLFKHRGEGFTLYDKREGLGSSFIFEITKDKFNNLWIGTENDGVFKFSNNIFKNYKKEQGLLHNNVNAILPLDDGTVLIGTGAGICAYKNEVIKPLKLSNDFLAITPVNYFYKTKNNTLWVGCKKGIAKLLYNSNNNTYESVCYKLPSKLPECETWSIIEDEDGSIWAGTYLGGLYKLNTTSNQFEYQNDILNIKQSSLLTLRKDNYGNFYAATLSGVLVFNPKTKKQDHFNEDDGLSSELVYSIQLTENGSTLWAGTNQGINKIDLDAYRKSGTKTILTYNKAEGFKGVECNTNGIYEEADGTIWFGTVNGLIKYSPTEFKENTALSKTHITNIKLFYADSTLAQGTQLPYRLNNISFSYRGICLTNPEKVKYIHQLEGLDKTWSPESNNEYTTYSNLPPGIYTFKVKSCNNEGIWNVEATSFTFEILAPYYKTWWFTLLWIGGITGIVFAVFRYRVYQLQKKQGIELEKQVEISKYELKALRSQMNPHFVFNSLNSIQHYIFNSKGEEAVKYLNKFAKLIRIILGNSDKPTVTIQEDIDSLKLYLELEKMRFDDKFDYSITIDSSIDPDYDVIPPMLMQPYAENAILHGLNPKKTKGHLSIKITNIDTFIICTITDDGIGRKKSKELKNIQVPGKKHESMGMRITKDRLRILNTMHKSNLSVNIVDLYNEQKEPSGTKVEIFIPILG